MPGMHSNFRPGLLSALMPGAAILTPPVFSRTAVDAPTATNLTIDLYPFLGDFQPQDLCKAGSMTMGGKQAYLFSSQSSKVVDAHFKWMEQYGLGGVLVQRFIGEAQGKRSSGDVVLKNVMAAALAHGRTFAIEYDLTGGSEADFAKDVETDWKYLVDNLKVTSHPSYLHHKGMPVVSLWGPGFSWSNLHQGKQNRIPRLGGKFLWRQAYNARAAGATMLKFAMFDEVDEGTAMFKVVSQRTQAPDQGYWLTLDPDNPASSIEEPAARTQDTGLRFNRVSGGMQFRMQTMNGTLRIFSPLGIGLRSLSVRDGGVIRNEKDASGKSLPSGLYLVGARGLAGGETFSRMVLP